MSEPIQSPPAPPSPFDPTPTRPTSGTGCSKPLLLGCTVLVVLLGISAVIFILNAPRLATWIFDRMGESIVSKLPDDIPQEDRERLQEGFRAVGRAAADGTLDPLRVQRLQGKIQALAARPPEQITRDDVLELIEALEEATGGGAAPANPP